MRLPDLDSILSAMLKTYDGISDLNFSVGRPLQVEDFGELKPVYVDPPIEALTPYQTEQIALMLMQGNKRLLLDYFNGGSCDCSYSLKDEARFRVNIFRQQGQLLHRVAPAAERCPFDRVTRACRRSSRKSPRKRTAWSSSPARPAAARPPRWPRILNEINETQPVHIVTLEDPIEFVHPRARRPSTSASSGIDFDNYPNGLRAALRQAPKVILVGEMRDRATVEIALIAAETGHLVLSTLHTVDAGQSINRILGFVLVRRRTPDAHSPCRHAALGRQPAPRAQGSAAAGILLTEVLGHNLRTKETIALGEGEHRSFYEIIEASSPFGWMTFDQSILNAYEDGHITEETARLYATRKGRVTRGIDLIQKSRGIDGDLDSGLRLDVPVNAFK